MSALLDTLRNADESYLIGMSSRGIYKRAVKDLEQMQVTFTLAEDTAEVQLGGEVCTLRDPLWESSCSCPSRSICRHLVAAILYVRDHIGTTEPPAEAEPEVTEAVPAMMPDALRKYLLGFDAGQLRTALDKLQSDLPDIQLEEGERLTALLPDGTIVRMAAPPEDSVCTCHSRNFCIHKAAAVAAWQLREGVFQPELLTKSAPPLPEPEAAAIRSCAASVYALFGNILEWGLVRLPESMTEHLEAAAVRSHALRMADAEHRLREISAMLGNYQARRAMFRTETFLQALTRSAGIFSDLQTGTITEADLGQFRRKYSDYPGDLKILPIGQRIVAGGEFAGDIYYFLNLDPLAEERFLTFSDLRPVVYDTVNPAQNRAVMPWGSGVTLRTLMHSQMVLVGAKLSGDKLSSSQNTVIASRTKANLDCDAVREQLHYDFRELAVWLSGQDRSREAQRLCFIHPSCCTQSGFDKHKQELRLTLADETGNCVDLCVSYRKEYKNFLEEIERIGRIMLETPQTSYVWLCLASFENGKLTLFPLEVYDFIQIPPHDSYHLPAEYARPENCYAPKILTLFEEIEAWMCELVYCGLQAAPERRGEILAEQTARCGMEGIAASIRKLSCGAENCRHSMHQDTTAVLGALTDLYRCLTIGRQELEVISALLNMQPQ